MDVVNVHLNNRWKNKKPRFQDQQLFTMEQNIHLLNGYVRSLSVQPDKTVMDLKISLSDDSKSLSSYGLRPGSKVWVLITEPAPFQVFLVYHKGQTHTYDVTPGETVSQFKAKIRNKEGLPTDQQRLVHEGRQLEDGKTLEDYGIKSQSTIDLFLRLRG